MPSSSPDQVYLRGLRLELCVGPDAWGRVGKVQPVTISLQIETHDSLEAAAAGDDVSKTLDYGKLYKRLIGKLPASQYQNCDHLFSSVLQLVPEAKSMQLSVTLPKAALQMHGGFLCILKSRSTAQNNPLRCYDWEQTLKGIECACIIGVNPHERVQKQIVGIDLLFEESEAPLLIDATPQYHAIVHAVVQRVEGSSFKTVEALASAVAQTVTMDCGRDSVTVRVEKPNAIATIEAAGVQLHRQRSFFSNKDFWNVK